MHGEHVQQIELGKRTGTLGVHVPPTSNWKGQFEVMKKIKRVNFKVNAN